MKRHFPVILLLGCAAAFTFGVVQLFELRFETGDVYPPYSSLRSDPLGTMALYESLEKLPGLTVRRDYSVSDQLPDEPDTTYLQLGGDAGDWSWFSGDTFREIDRFVRNGGRLVITFFPQTGPFGDYGNPEANTNSVASPALKPNADKTSPVKTGVKAHATENEEEVWLNKRWGFRTYFQRLIQTGDAYEPVQVVNQTPLSLPRTLNWHSGMVFIGLDPAWRTIYARGADAVVIERKFGRGSVVMATDSYFASNEALERDRHADLLTWMVGANRQVVFDEAHFGIVESSGVAMLMRKYHLQGLAAGLMLLAGLFVWKNSTSLVPPHAVDQPPGYVHGKEAASGFVNLLRRNIAPRDLLATCFNEWKKSATLTGKASAAKLHQAEAVFQAENSRPARDRNLVRAYQTLCSTVGTQTAESPTVKPELKS
ncbi:MAG TPA: DUF4350 domain-containing protein [Verrucomicrobiae bacterium]|nr:DUF4350 domain-containing protein [Verrucomicrobiae bacterium]